MEKSKDKEAKEENEAEEFQEIMEEIIPREDWVEIIRLYYPAWKRGRPPIEIEIMLRMYLLQCWFSLSDEGVEGTINHMTVASKLLREDDEVVCGNSWGSTF